MANAKHGIGSKNKRPDEAVRLFGTHPGYAEPHIYKRTTPKDSDPRFLQLCQQLKDHNIHIAGKSKAIKQVVDNLARVAESDSTTVLITGDSGTGKELVALGIHALSKRGGNLFQSVNCSAVPETLFESEFFGHKKGAFTDAYESTSGYFERTQHGTLFLDEVAELPLPLQAKFLRVLDSKTVNRIGTKTDIKLDVRVIAATNKNLDHLVASQQFRTDLYYRLNSFNIHIPPLRERTDDIIDLINYFVAYFETKLNKKILRIDDKIYSRLLEYDFPGNVRELKNMIERAMIVNDGNVLRLKHIMNQRQNNAQILDTEMNRQEFSLRAIEKQIIHRALKKCRFNKTKAAQLLEITRQALDRKIEKHTIQTRPL